MKSHLLSLIVISTCALLTPAWADDVKKPAVADDGKKPAQAAEDPKVDKDAKAPPHKNYESLHATIVRECAVEEANHVQLLEVLKSWDTDVQRITPPVTADQSNLQAKLDIIDKEMTAATQSNNAQMIRDLTEKRRIVLDAMDGWGSDARKEIEDLDAKYQAALTELVPEEHREKLSDILYAAQEALPNRPRRAPVRSPRALRAMVDRLGDLTLEQRRGIDSAFSQYRELQRAGVQKPEDKARQDTKLYDDVFALLTDGQKSRVEQELGGRQAAAPPAAPNSATTPGTPATPAAPAGQPAAPKPATGAAPPAKAP